MKEKFALLRHAVAIGLALFASGPICAEEIKPIAIAEIKREASVDFEKEILPIFKKNCIACHNSAKAENQLSLESPQKILKGGDSGAAVEPKNSAASYLLALASHKSEPVMPPKDNKANAKPLSPEELGLIKLWIDQGAGGTVSAKSSPIVWQPLPPSVQPIFAAAVAHDGQFAVCGRGDQIYVYHVTSGQVVSQLSDPQLQSAAPHGRHAAAHLDVVQSLAFSPDGYLLASGGFQEVKLWRRPTNVQQKRFHASGAETAALAISPDRKSLASAHADHCIRLWNLADGKEIKKLAGHAAAITTLQFTPDNARLVSASHDKSIRVWNLSDGACVRQIDEPAPVNAIAMVAGGAQIVSAGGDGIIRVWPLSAESPNQSAEMPLKQLSGHAGAVTALAMVPGAGVQILSGGADGTARLWNVENGQVVRQFAHGGPVVSLAVRPDAQRCLTAGGNIARLWNLQDGKSIAELKGDFRKQALAAKAGKAAAKAAQLRSARKDELAATEKDLPAKEEAVKKAIGVLAETEKKVAEQTEVVKKAAEAKTAADKAVAEAAEAAKAAEKDAKAADKSKQAAAALAAADKALKDAEKQLTVNESAGATAQRAIDEARAVAKKTAESIPTIKGQIEAADAEVKRLETELEVAKRAAVESEKPIRWAAFSSDNLQAASGGDDRLVHAWDAATGAPLETYGENAAAGACGAFVDDGLLASAAGEEIVVWDLRPGWTLERTIGGLDARVFADRATALDFSPDGKLLAVGGGEPSRSGELKIVSAADGSLVREFTDAHSDAVLGLDFSLDGRYLASSGADKFVKVFDVQSGAFVRAFEGHTHHVLSVAWQADGKSLASAGADNAVKVWNFETGEQQRTIQGFGKQVNSICFIGETNQALTSSGDKLVRLHRADNGQSVRNFAGGTDFMNAAAATADGKLVVAGGHDGVLWIWQGETGQVLKSFPLPAPERRP